MNYENNDIQTSQEQFDEEESDILKNAEMKNHIIEEQGCVVTKNNNVTIHSMIIAGQIEGHYVVSPQTKSTKYEHIIPQLVAVEESPEIDGLLILLNTMGGDVEAGLAISEMIAGMKKPTVSLVLGGGHSIGVPLAVCTKKSFIVPSATMTVHSVRLNGLVIGVPQTFSYFTKMQERIIDFIVRHSHAKKETLRKLMLNTDELASDVGSVIDAAEAVNIGLIDSVGSFSDALSALKNMVTESKKNKDV